MLLQKRESNPGILNVQLIQQYSSCESYAILSLFDHYNNHNNNNYVHVIFSLAVIDMYVLYFPACEYYLYVVLE